MPPNISRVYKIRYAEKVRLFEKLKKRCNNCDKIFEKRLERATHSSLLSEV